MIGGKKKSKIVEKKKELLKKLIDLSKQYTFTTKIKRMWLYYAVEHDFYSCKQ